jgi:hypothetical protein
MEDMVIQRQHRAAPLALFARPLFKEVTVSSFVNWASINSEKTNVATATIRQ